MHSPAKIGPTSVHVVAACRHGGSLDVGAAVGEGKGVGVGGNAVGVCGTNTGTVEIAGGEVVMAVCSLPTKAIDGKQQAGCHQGGNRIVDQLP